VRGAPLRSSIQVEGRLANSGRPRKRNGQHPRTTAARHPREGGAAVPQDQRAGARPPDRTFAGMKSWSLRPHPVGSRWPLQADRSGRCGTPAGGQVDWGEWACGAVHRQPVIAETSSARATAIPGIREARRGPKFATQPTLLRAQSYRPLTTSSCILGPGCPSGDPAGWLPAQLSGSQRHCGRNT